MPSDAAVRLLKELKQRVSSLFERSKLELEPSLKQSFDAVALKSNFVVKNCLNNPSILQDLLNSKQLQHSLDAKAYQQKLDGLSEVQDLEQFSKSIRQLRNREMVRIAWRELLGNATVQESLSELSALADACILATLDFCYGLMAKRYAYPNSSGQGRKTLYVLAMGKLGGRELNFSSDIDLIFCYPDNLATTSQTAKITPQAFYTRVIQSFTKVMSTVGAEGFVFRVDLRLRPNGDSGALVASFTSMETYYQEQGRGWERYAMVKARVVNDDDDNSRRLQKILLPFIYRRYVDFSVIEALRSLKSLIEREVKIKGFEQDIKRGAGGIREIEFIVQSLQLIHGGKVKHLQEPNCLQALAVLKKERLIPEKQARALQESYLFLRRLENCLQMLDDRQTHRMPDEPLAKAQIAYAMAYDHWTDLERDTQACCAQVTSFFNQMLKPMVGEYQDDEKILQQQLLGVWQDIVDKEVAIELLASMGFSEADACYQLLCDFRHGRRCRTLSQIARLRLERFMPLLLHYLAAKENGRELLLRVFRLLDAIVRRSAYLALLTENIQALQHLLNLFSLSAWIAEQVSTHPFLLEGLLDTDALYTPLNELELERQLSRDLRAIEDQEQRLDALRHFKMKQLLRVAAADVCKILSTEQVSQHLTATATVILNQVLSIACQEISKNSGPVNVAEHMVIIAYGKLGGAELNYASDLDLVFLHDCSPEQEVHILRVVKRMLHLLNTRSAAGILYEVDTRLRPSGSAGLLLSHIDSYRDYQCDEAWVWEHQALVRARPVAGASGLSEKFAKIRHDTLSRTRKPEELKRAIIDMRQKMRKALWKEHSKLSSLKQGMGGLVDIEFMVQYQVLAHAAEYPELLANTGNLKLLKGLDLAAVIEHDSAEFLSQAYETLRQAMHHETLQSQVPQSLTQTEICELMNKVTALWQEWFV